MIITYDILTDIFRFIAGKKITYTTVEAANSKFIGIVAIVVIAVQLSLVIAADLLMLKNYIVNVFKLLKAPPNRR